jgi:hypothetical protein
MALRQAHVVKINIEIHAGRSVRLGKNGAPGIGFDDDRMPVSTANDDDLRRAFERRGGDERDKFIAGGGQCPVEADHPISAMESSEVRGTTVSDSIMTGGSDSITTGGSDSITAAGGDAGGSGSIRTGADGRSFSFSSWAWTGIAARTTSRPLSHQGALMDVLLALMG